MTNLKRLWLLCFVFVLCKRSRGVLFCDSFVERVFACENKSIELRCSFGSIHLLNATFGHIGDAAAAYECENSARQNNARRSVFSVDQISCVSPSTFYTIFNRCEAKARCNVDANVQSFGDPCPGISKKLTVEYQCRAFANATDVDIQIKAIENKLQFAQQAIVEEELSLNDLKSVVGNLQALVGTLQAAVSLLLQVVRQEVAIGDDVVKLDSKLSQVTQQVLQTNGVTQDLQRQVLKLEEAEAEPEPEPSPKATVKNTTLHVLL